MKLRKEPGLGTMLPVPYLNLNAYPSLDTITLSIICMKIFLDQQEYVNVGHKQGSFAPCVSPFPPPPTAYMIYQYH